MGRFEKMRSIAFPSGGKQFHIGDARYLVLCASLAYKPKLRIARELEAEGFAKVTFFDQGGMLGYLACHPGRDAGGGPFAVLAFRGTERDYRDILTDIRFLPGKTSDGEHSAHRGFLEALNQVWGVPMPGNFDQACPDIDVDSKGPSGVVDALAEIPDQRPVYYTGHSLGGALATLAANRSRPRAVYTFGWPRVATAPLAEFLSHDQGVPVHRLVHASDIVPHLPPWLLGYRHVGTTLYLPRHRGFCPQTSNRLFILYFFRDVLRWFGLAGVCFLPQRAVRPRFLKDHRIAAYRYRLRKELNRCATDRAE